MKLDYELIKYILEKHEKEGVKISLCRVGQDYLHPEGKMGEYLPPYDHYFTLFEKKYMDGFVDSLGQGDKIRDASVNRPFNIHFRELTPKGKAILNIMQNDIIWKQIKDDVIKMGDKGIDQIQNLALAIKPIHNP